jgi:hypothetical protein
MSARKRRAVGGDQLQNAALGQDDQTQRSWSIYPYGTGMLATALASQGHDLATSKHESGNFHSIASAASYIALSHSSPTLALNVHPRAVPLSKVLGLRAIECKNLHASQCQTELQLCMVSASDIKQEIVVAVLQPSDESTSASLPLLPLLSLSLSDPSSICCSIADGPTVVLWRRATASIGSQCLCVQWLGQRWVMHDLALPDLQLLCCFAHSLGASSETAAFVFSTTTGSSVCVIPAISNASSPPLPRVETTLQSIAAALHPVLPDSSSTCMSNRLVMSSVGGSSNESADPLLALSRASDCRFMSVQPRGLRSSAVIFTLRIVSILSPQHNP